MKTILTQDSFSRICWVIEYGSPQQPITGGPSKGEVTGGSLRVPTAISYDNGQVSEWGFLVSDDGSIAVRYFKLLLQSLPTLEDLEDSELVAKASIAIAAAGKTIDDVVKDFLRALYCYAIRKIRKDRPHGYRQRYELSTVLTIPKVWDAQTIDRLRRAAEKSGMVNLSFFEENDAAAAAVLSELAWSESMPVELL